jgi:hypothetical protein
MTQTAPNMETLSKHFRNLTKPVFQKHGFQQADILARWAEIAGPEIAAAARPERIRWPKGNETSKQGGTLHLIAKAGRALDVQYAIPQIIARINSYLGFGAISTIKVTASHEMPEAPKPTKRSVPAPEISGISDVDLHSALSRLGQAVAQEK